MAAPLRLLLVLPLLLAEPMGAAGQDAARLECQLGRHPWSPCHMQVAPDGLSWQLQLEGRSYRFRHDGRGVVSMRQGQAQWRVVETRWRSDASLCWGALCARGEIPLD